jgi:glycosyltransferase involved in cell wall biosynthesis
LIRIAHVTNQLETGGMERLLVEFARHADRRRFHLEFVCLGMRGSIAGVLESLGWNVHVLGMKPGIRPGAMLKLARMFRSSRVDLVHTHNTKPLLYSAPAMKVASVGGLIHTRHGERIGTSRRQDAAFALACKAADRVVCVSGATHRASVAEGLGNERLRTIENGIDLERFPFAGPMLGGPALYVGRLSPEKGVDVLLQAVRLIVSQEPAFRLRIAGTGPGLGEMGELARSLGVGGSVEFLGEVSDVAGQLSQASMLVLPSRSEGLSIAVLEAMGVGLPVVATRVGGTPEAVSHGTTGLLVEKEDVEGLAGAVLKLWRDRELARRLGTAGRESVVSRFDVRAMVARYEAMYAEVVEGRLAVAA